MRFWDPKITCDGSCRCYPAQALQVCGLSISSKDGSPITGAKISGFFAIRDHYDRRRIYIFKHEKEDEIDIVFKNVRQTAYLSYPIYFLSLLPIILFIFLVATAVAYYSKDRVEGETPYIWGRGRGRCVLAIAKFFLVLMMGLGVCWSISHYLKSRFLVLERGIDSLLEMLYISDPITAYSACNW